MVIRLGNPTMRMMKRRIELNSRFASKCHQVALSKQRRSVHENERQPEHSMRIRSRERMSAIIHCNGRIPSDSNL